MAKWVTSLNLNKNELQNAAIQNLAAAPSAPAVGQIYANTVDNKYYIYLNGTWQAIVTDANSVKSAADLTNGTTGTGAVVLANSPTIVTPTIASHVNAQHNHSNAAGGGQISHANLTGLTNDDHTQYVHNSTARTITAVHTYNPSSAGAPFALGTNATGQLVTGLNADKHDGFDASATPAANTIPASNGSGKLATGWTSGTLAASDLTNTTTGTGAVVLATSPTLVASSGVSLNAGSGRLSNLADPTSAQDAATMGWVQGQVTAASQGLDVKDPVKAVATANVTLSGTQTIDGVNLVVGERVAVIGQSTASQNGIYVVAAGAWARATDADSSSEVTQGMYFLVTAGTTYGSSAWYLQTANPITLNTTALTFVQFNGGQNLTAGAGLTKTGNTFDVGAGMGIVVNADDVSVSTALQSVHSVVGSATGTNQAGLLLKSAANTVVTRLLQGTTNKVTVSGTDGSANIVLNVGSSVVQTDATYADPAWLTSLSSAKISGVFGVGSGGTGSTTKAGARSDSGLADTGKRIAQTYAQDIGNNSATSIAVTHNLGTRDVTVMVRDNSTYEVVYADIVMTDTNTVTLTFNPAPTAAQYRVIVTG
ncbi:MAG TPA: hypothetical protein VF598_01750 [Hymenobacter sp.]|jgi:hypothetical protein